MGFYKWHITQIPWCLPYLAIEWTITFKFYFWCWAPLLMLFSGVPIKINIATVLCPKHIKIIYLLAHWREEVTAESMSFSSETSDHAHLRYGCAAHPLILGQGIEILCLNIITIGEGLWSNGRASSWYAEDPRFHLRHFQLMDNTVGDWNTSP